MPFPHEAIYLGILRYAGKDAFSMNRQAINPAFLSGWWKAIGCEGRHFNADQVELYFFSRDNQLFTYRPDQPVKMRMKRSPYRYEFPDLFIGNGPNQSSGLHLQVESLGEIVIFVHDDGARIFLRRLTEAESEIQNIELMRWEWSSVAIFGHERNKIGNQ
jgi:hypothetical protein